MEYQQVLKRRLSRDTRAAVPRVTLPDGSSRPLRILVADDSADTTVTSVMLLESYGYEVRDAFNGAFAVKQAERYLPDVGLLDLGMPVMSGYDVARVLRVREEHAGMVLVAISGHTQPAEVQRALAAGFDYHLAKPASLKQLLAILAAAATRRGAGAPSALPRA